MTSTSDGSKIELDPWNTPAGAMENAFLAETITPGYGSKYSPEEALASMRLMKQVLENRLKDPSLYKARDAKNEFDILRMGEQFPEFSSEGRIQGKAASDVHSSVLNAQDPNSTHYQEYRQYVQLAIQVANEKLAPSTVKWPNVTAWRTKKHGSPGSGFYKIGEFGGNVFFGTIADFKSGPQHLPDSGKLHSVALAVGTTHDHHSKLHGLALKAGRPSLGGFAPPPRDQKHAAKPVRGLSGHDHEAHHTSQHGSAATGNSLKSGALSHTSETSTGYRAVLVAAKAQEAKARQERESLRSSLLPGAASVMQSRSFAPVAANGAGMPMRMAARQNFAGGNGINSPFEGNIAQDFGLNGSTGIANPENLRPGQSVAPDEASATLPAMGTAAAGAVSQAGIGRALEDYAFRMSRLPPVGGGAFNPLLSPLWAGLKIPG